MNATVRSEFSFDPPFIIFVLTLPPPDMDGLVLNILNFLRPLLPPVVGLGLLGLNLLIIPRPAPPPANPSKAFAPVCLLPCCLSALSLNALFSPSLSF